MLTKTVNDTSPHTMWRKVITEVYRTNQGLAEDIQLFDPFIDTSFDWTNVPRTCNRLNVNVAFVQINLRTTSLQLTQLNCNNN